MRVQQHIQGLSVPRDTGRAIQEARRNLARARVTIIATTRAPCRLVVFMGRVPASLGELGRLRILELQRNYLKETAETVPDIIKKKIKFVYVQGQSTVVNLQVCVRCIDSHSHHQ